MNFRKKEGFPLRREGRSKRCLQRFEEMQKIERTRKMAFSQKSRQYDYDSGRRGAEGLKKVMTNEMGSQ